MEVQSSSLQQLKNSGVVTTKGTFEKSNEVIFKVTK